MNDNINTDRIEAYLLGHLAPAEAAAFEQEMAQNPALATEVDKQRLELRAMELLAEAELRANFSAWKAEKNAAEEAGGAKVVSIGHTRRLIFRIAAAASVLLLIGFFAQRLFTGPDQQELAGRYFDESATSVRVRGRADIPPALQPALASMDAGDYRGALAALQAVPDSAWAGKVQLLQGECYFRLKDFDGAIRQFQAAIRSGEPAEREEAEYLLLLTYMASGAHDAEAAALKERILGDSGHGYFGKVRGM
ncbi:MAG: tetratricopeptide repeat protein [Lewinellaceae bacterium]|nr:tetratricopeptide repeat protein [Lewinellaceae bacterium]